MQHHIRQQTTIPRGYRAEEPWVRHDSDVWSHVVGNPVAGCRGPHGCCGPAPRPPEATAGRTDLGRPPRFPARQDHRECDRGHPGVAGESLPSTLLPAQPPIATYQVATGDANRTNSRDDQRGKSRSLPRDEEYRAAGPEKRRERQPPQEEDLRESLHQRSRDRARKDRMDKGVTLSNAEWKRVEDAIFRLERNQRELCDEVKRLRRRLEYKPEVFKRSASLSDGPKGSLPEKIQKLVPVSKRKERSYNRMRDFYKNKEQVRREKEGQKDQESLSSRQGDSKTEHQSKQANQGLQNAQRADEDPQGSPQGEGGINQVDAAGDPAGGGLEGVGESGGAGEELLAGVSLEEAEGLLSIVTSSSHGLSSPSDEAEAPTSAYDHLLSDACFGEL